ncbi:hypothetical protein [Thiohalorhabdus sp.]|uniref:hypothetical protein n=1 Tax=Thiohalorhabdus sp. TaxID=3094134 RepID=UPI002FC33876
MFTSNPFAELTVFLSPAFMQIYIVLMILAVAAGTIYDMLHKKSFQFFMQRRQNSEARARRPLGTGQKFGVALKTLGKEVLTSGEFCNTKRQLSHLLLFYGFLLYLISTIVMVYAYPTAQATTPGVWPVLWNVGALMIIIGGGWFFFFLRVNVVQEQDSPFRLIPADLFVVSLVLSVLFGIIWEIVQAQGGLLATQILFGIYIGLTTLLFVSVPWSKFAHMFYKPAAAYQKRVEDVSGSDSLPTAARGKKQVASPGNTRT